MTTASKPTKDDALKPCPFCGAGTTQIVENGKTWTGMKYSEPSSVSVRHWCEPIPGQPSRMLERVGKDHASAVAAWNTREALAQPSADDADPNAPWLTEAHMLCSDQSIPLGHITARIRALRDKLDADGKAGGEPVVCSCAECGKTSTKDAMLALYCLDCIQEHGLGASNSLRPGYERLIDEYIENYEFTDGDAGYHEPSDFELAMIKDAFMGFDFSTLYPPPPPTPPAVVPDGTKKALRDLLVAHEMGASCQDGLVSNCLCVRCATARARAMLSASPRPEAQQEDIPAIFKEQAS